MKIFVFIKRKRRYINVTSFQKHCSIRHLLNQQELFSSFYNAQ